MWEISAKEKLGFMRSYFIHDNGGRPFRVDVAIPNVQLFVQDVHGSSPGHTLYQPEPRRTWTNVEKVWVGKSPLTRITSFSGGHGPKFDGNTLLLQQPNQQYVFIGTTVKAFATRHPIVQYVSEVGNNDVSYPYAVDQTKHYYLLIEDVILCKVPPRTEDVYGWYYENNILTPPHKTIQPTLEQRRRAQKAWHTTDLFEFYIGDEAAYTLSYAPRPAKEFRRLERMAYDDEPGPFVHGPLSVVTRQSYPERIPLTGQAYTDLMKDFGRRQGFRQLHYKTLVPRVF